MRDGMDAVQRLRHEPGRRLYWIQAAAYGVALLFVAVWAVTVADWGG